MRTGTLANLPANCRQNEMYFATDATPGHNLYGCSTNGNWRLQTDKTISALDFGVKADGTTNDVVALQNAVTYLISQQGGTLKVPRGQINLGTTGWTIPLSNYGIRIIGESPTATNFIYSGTGNAIQLGATNGTVFHHELSDFSITITNAGVDAVGLFIHPSLHVDVKRINIWSANTHDVGDNQQRAIVAHGGDSMNSLFGAYLNIENVKINGKFRKGIHLTADEIGWGYTAGQIKGGAIVYTGSPQVGYYGIHLEQAGQNLIGLVDVEQFGKGIFVESIDNVFVGARTEANTVGMELAAENPGVTTGGGLTKLIGCSFGDGLTNNAPNNVQIMATTTGVGSEMHIGGFAYLDSTLLIPGNSGFSWEGAAGGSTGFFWKDGNVSTEAGLYYNGSTFLWLINSTFPLQVSQASTTVTNKFHLAQQTPSSATDTCTANQFAFDGDYVYVCVATNTWKRTALSTWP